jgi:hypothetical protein
MTAKMLKEVTRVLKVGGVYLIISYGDPDSRTFHLTHEFLSFDIKQYKLYYADDSDEEEVGGSKLEEPKSQKVHYIYVCRKNADADELSTKYFDIVLKQLSQDEEFSAQEESNIKT